MTSRKTHTEQLFQEKLVNKLKENIWEAPESLNGNNKKVTVNDLVYFWREELNRLNADILEGVPLTDNEFSQVMSKVNSINNSYEAAKILSVERATGKIDGIYRDSHPKVTRDLITLTIFVKASVSGGSSRYSIAREVEMDSGHRFDIVLLINGLPLINIELKRADRSLDEAFGQFKRYYRAGDFINNFMAFSQMMIIMSEVATRYFATPKDLNSFNPSFVFQWTDVNNIPINNWEKVAETLLRIPMIHQLVGDYLIIDEAKDEENRRHMIMRPYQVYALQSILLASGGKDNPEGIPHGGYIWHTTGSGKTITSFKTALFLSTRTNADKVVFLVDRKELDQKTSEEFKSYSTYEAVSVDDTKHTYHLRKELLSNKSGIIVTTTFKLNALVKDLIEHDNSSLKDKKIIFIIDEAHRTTMGQMMGTIKNYFKENGLFYGFTGTPLFEENKVTGKINEKSELIDTTEKLFGPLLHQYTIDRAIEDGNVLGFHVNYINTGEFENHDSLKQDVIEALMISDPETPKRKIEEKVLKWSNAEVEEEATKLDILRYHDKNHIPQVVNEILDNWNYQSQEKEFNAILTVAYKDRVVAYYKEFKRQMANRNEFINVAMTVSFGNENDPDNVAIEMLEEIFEDYREITGVHFNHRDLLNAPDNYFDDLITRTKRGGSSRNKNNLDLVIVADQLLTGYDSRFLNTLYVDRNLKLQNLIQAYSRTNRIHGSNKEFGTIVNFQYPALTEQKVNEALVLYGSGGSSTKVTKDKYVDAIAKFNRTVIDLKQSLNDPSKWQELESKEDDKSLFFNCFLSTRNELNTITQYYEFKWDERLTIDEHSWLKYVGAYKNLSIDEDEPEPELPNPLVGKTKLAGTQIIDSSHIVTLIGERAKLVNGVQIVDNETMIIIYAEIQELSNMGNDEQAKLLEQFVEEELKPGKISGGITIEEAFNIWKKNQMTYLVIEFSKEWGLDEEMVGKALDYYSPSNKENIPFYNDIVKNVDGDLVDDKFANRLVYFNEMKPELIQFMIKSKRKFEL